MISHPTIKDVLWVTKCPRVYGIIVKSCNSKTEILYNEMLKRRFAEIQFFTIWSHRV